MQTAQWKDQELRGVIIIIICVVVLPLFSFSECFVFTKHIVTLGNCFLKISVICRHK